ncbi:MAG: thiamine-phosphate kinase [Candidatus Eisenbacteria bacterium]|uniref:Thiamine-monophosphate kinase n=1 Tax=Eiseniibacteriota bacterium TaxID=2212470 RepID=A0A948RWR8_UNCEI|nr:thiamine-phosphate kinase [Candidatus Eisenbacteria bacterium]MBU1949374.1 thiamine-phosphate kinase [Candidatus Eisenbacteria bacterium]MBU2690447.1 thiamine-phosphate kinase [Candidatus Eisenbacteria bacterium]
MRNFQLDASKEWGGEPLLSDVGEMEILKRIRTWLEERSHLGREGGFLTLGAGDDAALIRPRASTQLALTCDIHLEGRHFLTQRMTPRDVGRRVMVSNISDLAAMGATPRVALISMALPKSDPVDVLFNILEGLAEELKDAGGQIAGGNLSATDGPRVVDVTLVGEVEGDAFLRSGAQAGDVILLIGHTGLSAAGLWAMDRLSKKSQKMKIDETNLKAALRFYIRPRHHLKESLKLREMGGVKALIDTSDGLLSDLGHLCEAGGLGADIQTEQIPILEPVRKMGKAAKIDPLEWALGSSDDYALLAAVAPGSVERILSALSPQAHAIGEFVMEPGLHLLGHNNLNTKGWDHFKSG